MMTAREFSRMRGLRFGTARRHRRPKLDLQASRAHRATLRCDCNGMSFICNRWVFTGCTHNK